MRRFAIAVLAILGSACAPGADVSTSPEHAVLVHLKLSDSGFGTEAEREALFELEQRLERAILAAAVGEFDGNEVGEGLCTLYMYGPQRRDPLCRCRSRSSRLATREGRNGHQAIGPTGVARAAA